MIGAIAGDIIGSVYEWHPIKTKEFPLFQERCFFTDDSVLTIAVADAVMNNDSYLEAVLGWSRRYPDVSYGSHFRRWFSEGSQEPYNSWGNGSAMRVSAIGYAFDSVEDVLTQAELSAQITHNHPEGIKGAQATALSVFLARITRDKAVIKNEIVSRFGYDLGRNITDIRLNYAFDVSCQGTVPEAIIAFLESNSYEDAIRNAISLGGDSDTLACITGGIAEAFYGVPEGIRTATIQYLTPDLLEVVNQFLVRYEMV